MRYAVVVHMLMSQAEIELWQAVADRCQLELDDALHATALSGLTYQLKHAGDKIGTHMAEVCERGLLARLGREVCDAHPGASPART